MSVEDQGRWAGASPRSDLRYQQTNLAEQYREPYFACGKPRAMNDRADGRVPAGDGRSREGVESEHELVVGVETFVWYATHRSVEKGACVVFCGCTFQRVDFGPDA